MSDKVVLEDNDVVSITGGINASICCFGLKSTFKASELIEFARVWIARSGHETSSYSWWFDVKGLECQVLRTNGVGWELGRVRVRIEFVPYALKAKSKESVSPLDDLRAHLGINTTEH